VCLQNEGGILMKSLSKSTENYITSGARLIMNVYVTKRRNKSAALKFLRKTMSKIGPPKQIVTDKLRSYKAALRYLNIEHLQETQRYKNNQIENSHLHFRRREKIMNKFRLERSLQKFTSIQSNFQNHFNNQRHIESRDTLKNLRQSSLSAWNEILVS
jgi:putative transposase